MTPEKKIDVGKDTTAVKDVVDEGSSKIKAAVLNLKKVHETPKLPTQKSKTQSSMSSARKPSLDRHKSLFK